MVLDWPVIFLLSAILTPLFHLFQIRLREEKGKNSRECVRMGLCVSERERERERERGSEGGEREGEGRERERRGGVM